MAGICGSVLEVGRYGPVCHTGTFLACIFLTTVIHRNSFVATKRVFWAQNTTHTFAARVQALHQTQLGSLERSAKPLAGWVRGRREVGTAAECGRGGRWKGREREGEGRLRNKSIPVLLLTNFEPWCGCSGLAFDY